MSERNCKAGHKCRESSDCAGGDTCPHGGGWKHTVHCVKHDCAHDFNSGPWIEFEDGSGGTASCACGLTAIGHGMRYGP